MAGEGVLTPTSSFFLTRRHPIVSLKPTTPQPSKPPSSTPTHNSNDTPAIDRALDDLGIETERRDAALRREMAFGMFDTRGKVDPFDKNSPIKQCAITRFPPDLFFVLRVVQLLRGMANGMGIDDFSSAAQWAPLARRALRREERKRRRKDGSGAGRGWRSDPVMDITALAVPLQLNV